MESSPSGDRRGVWLLSLHRDALRCILDFLSLTDVAALLTSCRQWPALNAELANDQHPSRQSRADVRLVLWEPGHPVWDGTSSLRNLLTAVKIVHVTLPSTIVHLRIVLPFLRELHIIFPRLLPDDLEWSLPPRLELLDVEWLGIPLDAANKSLYDVAAALGHLVHLTSLRVVSNPFVECHPLLDAVRMHPRITHLEMEPFSHSMLDYLTREPHDMRLQCLPLPDNLSICENTLARLPSLTTFQSSRILDLTFIASLPALTELRICFVPDTEEDPIWEPSQVDKQRSLFLEHLPRLSELRILALQLPIHRSEGPLRKAFAGDVLFRAIHSASFHLLQLDLCDWLLKAPLLASLLRLPALASLKSFRHRFTRDPGDFPDEGPTYDDDDDDASLQQQRWFKWCIQATQAHQLSLTHLTELQMEHPSMTTAELIAVLLGMPSLTSIRLSCPHTRARDGHLLGVAALSVALQILRRT
jgi:hypothetical protein